ncbi:MAG: hypothetical protein C4K60_00115 [Ideonella sp. MAG2]|nr:MAG: hypothetical protein C4K60_00115 [Ideonella sp. MAG2]
MKWLAALCGLIVGAFVSPIAALTFAVAGWFVAKAVVKGDKPPQGPRPSFLTDPDDQDSLRRQVELLSARVSTLESQVKQLAKGQVPPAPTAAEATPETGVVRPAAMESGCPGRPDHRRARPPHHRQAGA